MAMISRLVTVLVPNQDVAITTVNLFIVFTIIFSGYLIPINSCPDWLVWIMWLSPIQYAYRGLAYNEYIGLQFECKEEELVPNNDAVPVSSRVCSVSTGEAYIENRFGYSSNT